MSLGKRVAALRTAKGFRTVNSLAVESGIAQSQLRDIELDNADPRLSTLQKLAGTLGVTLSQLVGEDDQPDLTWFWQTRFAALTDKEADALQESAGRRMAWAMRQLLSARPVSEVSNLLGLRPDHLKRIADGEVPVTPDLENLLAQRTGLSINWIRLAQTGPLDDDLRALMQDPNAGEALKVLTLARKYGILPDLLRRLVETLIQASANTKPPA